MHWQREWWSALVGAVLGGLLGVTAAAVGEQFLPAVVTDVLGVSLHAHEQRPDA